jgi:hypothetical protein
MNNATITLGYYDARTILIALDAEEAREREAGRNMTANMLYGLRDYIQEQIDKANPKQPK